MQLALRPVAVRALLLLAGILLGIAAFLTAFAATDVTQTSSAAVTSDSGSDNTLIAGTRWR